MTGLTTMRPDQGFQNDRWADFIEDSVENVLQKGVGRGRFLSDSRILQSRHGSKSEDIEPAHLQFTLSSTWAKLIRSALFKTGLMDTGHVVCANAYHACIT